MVEMGTADTARIEKLFANGYHLDAAAIQSAVVHRSMLNMIPLNHVVKVDCILRKETEYRQLEFSRRRQAKLEERSFDRLRTGSPDLQTGVVSGQQV